MGWANQQLRSSKGVNRVYLSLCVQGLIAVIKCSCKATVESERPVVFAGGGAEGFDWLSAAVWMDGWDVTAKVHVSFEWLKLSPLWVHVIDPAETAGKHTHHFTGITPDETPPRCFSIKSNQSLRIKCTTVQHRAIHAGIYSIYTLMYLYLISSFLLSLLSFYHNFKVNYFEIFMLKFSLKKAIRYQRYFWWVYLVVTESRWTATDYSKKGNIKRAPPSHQGLQHLPPG